MAYKDFKNSDTIVETFSETVTFLLERFAVILVEMGEAETVEEAKELLISELSL